MEVFIENEAGKKLKNIFDEKALVYKNTVEVSAPYPFPYGFILNTTSGDGDNLDCFVLTDKALKAGQVIDVEPLGMLEMFEDEELDHKIIARLKNTPNTLDEDAKKEIVSFLNAVFAHVPNKRVELGEFGDVNTANKLIAKCIDR